MLARIENNTVAEFRDIALDAIPAHKQAAWRPVDDIDPPFNAAIQTRSGPVVAIEADRVTRTWTVTDRDLGEIKAKYAARLDADAEAVRAKYMSGGSGMAMTYQEKFAQARAVDDLGQAAADALTPTEAVAQFPTLAASIGIEETSLWMCAQLVITKYEQFAQLSYIIEGTRLAGKQAISDASDAATVLAVYEAIQWTV